MNRRHIFPAAAIVLASLCLPPATHAQRIAFIVRHAERADTGESKMQTQKDPGLSAQGEKRAAKLASMLADAGIKGIYATEYRRAQDTAKPLAAKVGLQISTVSDTDRLIADIRSRHADDIILIVGHSNTVPDIIKELCGAKVTIDEREYDNLFIVVPATKAMTRIRFSP